MGTALTIAGSDSSGASGIQADLRTFSEFGVSGTSVITAVTSQNISNITDIHYVPSKFISSQIDAVCSEFRITAFKTGMIGNSENVTAIINSIKKHSLLNYVLDPVIISSSNVRLLTEEGLDNLIKNLLPLAYLITPNILEAEKISGLKIENIDQMKDAAKKIFKLGASNVLIKGGHLKESDPIDILYSGNKFKIFESKRINKEMRGTGCALSSAIASNLTKKLSLIDSIEKAKEFIFSTISNSKTLQNNQKNSINIQFSANLCSNIDEGDNIISSLTQAASTLKELRIGSLIPEIQSNMSYAKKDAKDTNDVASFPGRITKAGDDVFTVLGPTFGASKHIAKIVLTAMKYDKSKRACMNIRYDEELVTELKTLGLTIFEFDRRDEPLDTKKPEGSTLEWGTESVIKENGFVPDIIYDKGDIGKEPVIRIIAETPDKIVEIIEKII